jgi:hypothetical protein
VTPYIALALGVAVVAAGAAVALRRDLRRADLRRRNRDLARRLTVATEKFATAMAATGLAARKAAAVMSRFGDAYSPQHRAERVQQMRAAAPEKVVVPAGQHDDLTEIRHLFATFGEDDDS